MNVSIHAKKGFLYGVITYYDEANVKRHKWISTGLKERGNKKEAKRSAEEKAEEFDLYISTLSQKGMAEAFIKRITEIGNGRETARKIDERFG